MLAPVDVDLGVGEIRQAAGMVEVQVREDNVPHSLAWDPKAGELLHSRCARVAPQAEIQCEEADETGWALVVVHTHAGVGQDGSLIGLYY